MGRKLQIYPPSTCIQLFWRSWLDWGRELRVRGTSEDIIIGGMAALDLMRGMEEGQDILVTEHKETDLQLRIYKISWKCKICSKIIKKYFPFHLGINRGNNNNTTDNNNNNNSKSNNTTNNHKKTTDNKSS